MVEMSFSINSGLFALRPPRGVCEAHLHLVGKPYVIATKAYDNKTALLKNALKAVMDPPWWP